jgi:hypothetical protein
MIVITNDDVPAWFLVVARRIRYVLELTPYPAVDRVFERRSQTRSR